jgi:hypothetical protein
MQKMTIAFLEIEVPNVEALDSIKVLASKTLFATKPNSKKSLKICPKKISFCG